MDTKKRVDKNQFKFVGQERKVYDQPFEGKPVGYFKDAMIRFRKNKINVIAAIILSFMILMAIFVPVFTNKNYTVIEEQLTYLPPRVPILEKFGILDGNEKVKKKNVDLTTIDSNTELGLPNGYDLKYVVPGTLTNYYAPSNDSGANSIGGEVIFRMGGAEENYTVSTQQIFNFKNGDEITINVTDFENFEDSTAILYIILRNRVHLIGELDETGELTFLLDGINGTVNSEIFLEVKSPNKNAGIIIESIEGSLDSGDDFDYSGYTLFSEFKIIPENGGNGTNLRINNQTLYSDFEYMKYEALFSSRVISISGSEYNKLLEENPDMVPTEDPANPGQLIFPDGYVLKRVLSTSTITNPSTGEVYLTYRVEADYAQYMGYDGIPYFLFGTDASGKDLFALSWVGLRTSLIIGIIVSMINITFGVVYGSISGYYGGKVDLIMERITEVVGRIPWLVTLSIVTALIGTSFLSLIIVLIISGWIGVASVTRTQFYRYKGREYVLASRTLGANDRRLIFRHILPNGIGTIITSSVLMIPGVIFSESSISYLGFGVGHGQTINFFGIKLSGASLGVLLADGQAALLDYPHLTVYPAIIISILMITFNMFGNGLRDAFNPSLRGAE